MYAALALTRLCSNTESTMDAQDSPYLLAHSHISNSNSAILNNNCFVAKWFVYMRRRSSSRRRWRWQWPQPWPRQRRWQWWQRRWWWWFWLSGDFLVCNFGMLFWAIWHVVGHEALKKEWYVIIKAYKFTVSEILRFFSVTLLTLHSMYNLSSLPSRVTCNNESR